MKSNWVNTTDSLPDIAEGDEINCFVSFQNRNGKQSVTDCYYVNKPIPDDEDDCELFDHDGKPISIVGWYVRGSHPDYNHYYEPFSEFITHWKPIIYPSRPDPVGENK